MKSAVMLRHTVIGGILLLAATGSMGLTLGRTRGAVLIGQPLDVVVPVRLDAGDDPSGLCFEADVFHADNRVDGARVRVTTEAGATSQDVNVRVRSAAAVDEPVVTVYLRAGCTQKVTRRYVLLADVASEVGAPVLPVPGPALAPMVPAAPAAAAAAAGRPAVAPAVAGANAPGAAAVEKRRKRKDRTGETPAAASGANPGQAVAAAKPAPAAKRRGEAAGGRSRLKLDPLDLTEERDPTLRSTDELQTSPTDSDLRRAEAAALWRAINAQPQDVLRDAQRLQGLEADVKSLRELASKNQASLGDLRVQLQKAESERYANGLVYGLIALLIAAAAATAYFWRRGRNGASQGTGQDWWRGRDRDVPGEDHLGLGEHFPTAAAPPVSGKPLTEVDVDLGIDESMFESLKSRTVATAAAQPQPRPSRPPAEQSDFGISLPGGARAVNAEELFDIQQQADFFVSLGQHEQAIEVLKNHISDNVETSALAYLDLLKIYHTLNRREDYNHLREDFNRVFNAQVPPFEAFSDESSGLEAYQMALSRIVALWPSPKVLDLIEESIFRKPGTGDGEAFDLEAYRELLLLYAMAKDVVDRRTDSMDFEISGPTSAPPDGSSLPRAKFSATSIQPLSAHMSQDTRPMEPLPEIPLPKPSPRLGLDIDLSDPLPASAFIDADSSFTAAPPAAAPAEAAGPDEAEVPTAADNNLIDFDLFDSSTEEEIAPKPRKH